MNKIQVKMIVGGVCDIIGIALLTASWGAPGTVDMPLQVLGVAAVAFGASATLWAAGDLALRELHAGSRNAVNARGDGP